MMAASELIGHVKRSISMACNNMSKLTEDILRIEGMSGDKTRHLYNNICSLEGVNYLEVGSYKGSSTVSAMFKNNIRGYCVDNWGQYGGRSEFASNVQKFLPSNDIRVIEKDCWLMTLDDVKDSIQIFLYDGSHTYEDQKRAITYFTPFFSERVIIMIDDWMCDWVDVKSGTLDGIKEANLKVLFQHEIGLVNTTDYHVGGDTFWNGCGIFVCERKNTIDKI
jgi:hypothetical protein